MAEESVLMVGKVIGRAKNGVFDIDLISHVNDYEFNKMRLFCVRRFAIEQENYISKIYNISHPCTDSSWKDASLDRNDQGISYGLDDTKINDSEFEDMKKYIHHLSLKRSMKMNNISQTGYKRRVIKFPIICFLCLVKEQEEAHSLDFSR